MPRSWSATPQHLQHTVSKRAGDVRLAVRAAHFLKSLREDVEEDHKGKAVVQQGESEAMRLAKQFGFFEKRELLAKRTTVTDEVAVKGEAE